MKGDCVKTCTIFYIIFVINLLVFSLTIMFSGDLKHLEKVLDKDQLKMYEKIKKERLNHFHIGLGVGGILGLSLILSNNKIKSKFCWAGIILLITTPIVYYILPKSGYMVKHLKTEEQKMAWMKVHRNFIKKKIAGFLSLIILYFCVPFLFKK